jgi:hypothetical protein
MVYIFNSVWQRSMTCIENVRFLFLENNEMWGINVRRSGFFLQMTAEIQTIPRIFRQCTDVN